jgi:hypothetical protein
MKFTISSFLILFLSYINVLANEAQQIELKDGSIISGEIVSLSNGIYTIDSNSLGNIKIEKSKVRTIHSKSYSRNSSILPTTVNNTVQTLQNTIMRQPDLIEMIMTLQNDPDIQMALQDSKVMSAVMSGNINALIDNPAFQKILENPRVQAISREIEAK